MTNLLRWLLLSTATIASLRAATEPPRLVLQITVDQLRGDMLPRLREKFGPGGFRRLLGAGTYFANAHYTTTNTFTAAGHAVLVTGADTAGHGMVANEWFDRASGRTIASVFDPRHPVVGEPARPGAGSSPLNLSSTTIGDELVAASAGSRAFAVAGKDRSAIIPGGHRGRAYWWSESSGRFVTSTYYGTALPAWVIAWNTAHAPDRRRARTWQPLDASGEAPLNPHARPPPGLGRSFPHPLVAQSDQLFFAAFKFTPWLDEHTCAFARELIAQEELGRRSATDYLSLSFSGHDYIGHVYGPDSPEYADSLLRLDRNLAGLFQFLHERIGFERILVILSADHGMDDIPEARRAAGLAAGRIQPERLRAEANAALRQRFAVAEDLVAAFVPPGLYLNAARLNALALDGAAVEAALAGHLRGVPGVAHAFAATDLRAGRVPDTPIGARVRRGFHPERSGDVVIVQERFWYMYPEPEQFAAMHGSPYDYDTFVPIIVCGPGIPQAENHATVSPAQIAPTLAALLGIKPPSGCAQLEPLPGIGRR